MNPYDVLNQIRNFRALSGVLIRKSGERVEVKVQPEGTRTEAFQGGMIGAVAISAWSTSDVDLNPGEGDVLELTTDDGRTTRGACARNSETGRYWDWRYDRPGHAIVFYTRRTS